MLKKKLLVVNKIKGFITKGSICYSESIITDCTFTKMIITIGHVAFYLLLPTNHLPRPTYKT